MSSPVQRVVDHVAYRRRRLRLHVRSVVFGGHDPSKAIWITSWQRSGSTWLAEMLASPPRTRLVYEPANIPDDCFDGAEAALTPPPRDSPVHTSAVVRGLSGTVRHWWSDQFNRTHLPKRLVVKDVRALGIAGSVAAQLSSTPIVILVRNPIDVATSAIRLGWFDPTLDVHTAFLGEVTRWCEYHERALRDERLRRALWVNYEALEAEPLGELNRLRAYLLTYASTWRALDLAALDTTRRSATDFTSAAGPRIDPAWITEAVALVDHSPFATLYGSIAAPPDALATLVHGVREQ
jgi:Sulfotransferase family